MFLEFDIYSLGKKFFWQQDNILVTILPPVMVRPPGQNISLDKCFARVMLENVIEQVKEYLPSGLLVTDFVGILVICKVLVIGKNLHPMRGSLQEMLPYFKGSNNH